MWLCLFVIVNLSPVINGKINHNWRIFQKKNAEISQPFQPQSTPLDTETNVYNSSNLNSESQPIKIAKNWKK